MKWMRRRRLLFYSNWRNKKIHIMLVLPNAQRFQRRRVLEIFHLGDLFVFLFNLSSIIVVIPLFHIELFRNQRNEVYFI